jgi:NAD(P)-dependent dehydrogenase (short-subunit alcohol dehydrogenase family)
MSNETTCRRVAVVTGAGTGIGRATARALAADACTSWRSAAAPHHWRRRPPTTRASTRSQRTSPRRMLRRVS